LNGHDRVSCVGVGIFDLDRMADCRCGSSGSDLVMTPSWQVLRANRSTRSGYFYPNSRAQHFAISKFPSHISAFRHFAMLKFEFRHFAMLKFENYIFRISPFRNAEIPKGIFELAKWRNENICNSLTKICKCPKKPPKVCPGWIVKSQLQKCEHPPLSEQCFTCPKSSNDQKEPI
jgi:hypothetical protein